jgi:hypothetical protein
MPVVGEQTAMRSNDAEHHSSNTESVMSQAVTRSDGMFTATGEQKTHVTMVDSAMLRQNQQAGQWMPHQGGAADNSSPLISAFSLAGKVS